MVFKWCVCFVFLGRLVGRQLLRGLENVVVSSGATVGQHWPLPYWPWISHFCSEFCAVPKFKGFFGDPSQPRPLLVPDLQIHWGFWQLCCICLCFCFVVVVLCCLGFSFPPLTISIWSSAEKFICTLCGLFTFRLRYQQHLYGQTYIHRLLLNV